MGIWGTTWGGGLRRSRAKLLTILGCRCWPSHAISSSPEAPALPQETAAGDGQYLGSSFTPERYRAAVARAIEYIAAGDIFQVNLSQRFHVRTTLEPEAIYARAQHRYPAWFGALLQYEDFSIVCNSPELFLRTWQDESGRWRIVTRPIKGTRPRQSGMDRELLQSVKDQAELNMIVDLERNDLGRICQIGSVRVTEPRTIETHPTVYHGAATVEGMLRSGTGLVDVLAATFPGGSITGAPKIRAMQIIDELEPIRRGPYCGAIGLLDADGSIMLNMAIRIMIIRGRDVWIPVGGGIVADSTPEGEYDETLVKARAAMCGAGHRDGIARVSHGTVLAQWWIWWMTIRRRSRCTIPGCCTGRGCSQQCGRTAGSCFGSKIISSGCEVPAQALSVPLMWKDEELAAAAKQLLQVNALADARLRLTVTRGRVTHDAQQQMRLEPNVFLTAAPLQPYPKQYYEKGLTAIAYDQHKLNPFDILAGHKALDYFGRFAALRHANERGAGEALWFNVHNYLQSGSISNVFIVRDARLHTPPTHRTWMNHRSRITPPTRGATCCRALRERS